MKRKLLTSLIAGLILLFSISLVGCGSGSSVAQSSTTNKEVKKLSKEELQQMYTDPDKFKGYEVDIYAKIFANVERDDKGTYIQAFEDPKNSTNNTIISIKDPNLDVKDGDIIHVIGTVYKKFEGTNAFGAKITAPSIIASKIEKTDYATAFSPAIKTINLNSEQNQNGYVIKINRVELAEQETRVYLTVTNKMSNEKINFYTFNTKIVQGGKQLGEQTDYDANYPQMESDILPGVSEDGVIAFAPVDPNGENLKISLEGSCDNYEITINPFTFQVPLK